MASLEALCQESFLKEDPGTGRLDRRRFQVALQRVLGSLALPQPDATWFDRVFESYAPKCGGNGVSLRAMEDAAKQFVNHHQKKREQKEQSAKQIETSTPGSEDRPAKQAVGRPEAVKAAVRKQVIEETALPVQLPHTPFAPAAGAALGYTGASGSPSRPGYGRAVELASAVMCPMKQGSSVLEDYVMDQKIGEGSFGQVCVVTHRLTGQRRACKRVAINTDMDRRLVETEIQLLKKLDHGNIMRLSECYVDGPSLYLISELCEGGTLLQGFARHGSEAQAAAAVRQILSATAYCHARGVIHRDLKPDNVLYATKAPDSAVKVIDFGLADFLQRLRAVAGGKAMERAGTLAFMAPEMLSSDGSYGEKVDVWAIGCILYLLITGQHPFWPGRGTSEKQLIQSITSGQVPQHPNFRAAPAAAQDLTVQLMAKDPLRRAAAQDALRHPWLRAESPGSAAQVLDKSVFEGLCKYQASSKLKRAVLKLLAKEADEERVKKLREQFRTLNVRQDGYISREELLRGLRQCPEFAHVTALDLARILPPELFAEKISCTDFTAALLSLQGFRKAELLAAFRRFDVRQEGKISLAALSEVLKNAGSSRNSDTPRMFANAAS